MHLDTQVMVVGSQELGLLLWFSDISRSSQKMAQLYMISQLIGNASPCHHTYREFASSITFKTLVGVVTQSLRSPIASQRKETNWPKPGDKTPLGAVNSMDRRPEPPQGVLVACEIQPVTDRSIKIASHIRIGHTQHVQSYNTSIWVGSRQLYGPC